MRTPPVIVPSRASRPAVTITWEAQCRYIHLAWSSTLPQRDGFYRPTLLTALALVRGHRATTLLVTPGRGAGLSRADERWTVERWLPLACAAGLRRAALVWPDSAPARRAVSALALLIEAPLEVAFVADVVAARAWAVTQTAAAGAAAVSPRSPLI